MDNNKIVVSCSRRTDIPACYSKWLMNRIRAGYCHVPNPFNPMQVFKVPLNKDDTSVIVFWTKNAAPLLQYLDKINEEGLNYYFQFTLNNYPDEIEPGIPPLKERIKTFRDLSEKIGKKKVIWRYDPIIISDKTDARFHIDRFRNICDQLQGSTKRCVLSIVDIYRKTERRLKDLEKSGFIADLDPLASKAADEILKSVVDYANKHNIEVFSCAEGAFLEKYGIQRGKCIDDELIKKLFGYDLGGKKDANQRKLCDCISSKDIGMNNSCLNGCVYCYSTSSSEAAKKNFEKHDPDSEMLIGKAPEDAEIIDVIEKMKKKTMSKTKKKKTPSLESKPEQLDLFSEP